MEFSEYAGIVVGLLTVVISIVRAALGFLRQSKQQLFYYHNKLGELEIAEPGHRNIVVSMRDASEHNIEELDRAIDFLERQAHQQKNQKSRVGLSKEKTIA